MMISRMSIRIDELAYPAHLPECDGGITGRMGI